ncbi:MAG: CRISPR-associated endoribonuclease Cas6 [Prolixibacteraceae bacterium]|jgi:CRISPR-associated endoribonuclease Cas6|nr:CRISPR-associated endoribonuclease Cas6 [Prolixibacteraceae bacterium]
MRVHLKIKTTNKIVPFDHQPLLTGTIHKWLGWNDKHGEVSLYSFSRLEGGKATISGLHFSSNAYFFISSTDETLIKKLIEGIQADPDMFHGLKVFEIIIQEDPDLSGRDLYYVASPVFIKRRVETDVDHILFNDPRADACLKETLLTKMEKVGLTDETLDIRFDKSYPNAGTKKVTYDGIHNRASWCPVIIEGKPETKLFAWNVGLGNSTGIGFGAIK